MTEYIYLIVKLYIRLNTYQYIIGGKYERENEPNRQQERKHVFRPF